MPAHRLAWIVLLSSTLLPSTAPAGETAGATQTASALESSVADALDRERDLRRLEVAVMGSEATLRGPVPHLFAKNQAIELALGVEGIQTVVSEIELPEREEDEDLAEVLGREIQRYPFYNIWDYLDAYVNQGVVTLRGSVTPERDKKTELYERIAKIEGVQDYNDDGLEVQSPSSADARLREAIARNLFRSDHFFRFRTMTNPPFHILVNRSVVTLLGYVQTQIEYNEMQRIVSSTQGVLRVDNQIQVLN